MQKKINNVFGDPESENIPASRYFFKIDGLRLLGPFHSEKLGLHE